jgi:hypothetical protein
MVTPRPDRRASLHGVPERSDQERGGDLRLHQIVLSTRLDGACRGGLIRIVREYHDGHVRAESIHAVERDHPAAVRQIQAQQNRVESPTGEACQSLTELPCPLQGDAGVLRHGELLAELVVVSLVPFDQQDFDGPLEQGGPSPKGRNRADTHTWHRRR